MKRLAKITLVLALLAAFSACDILKQTITATQCKYDYNSVANLRLSGVDLSKGVNLLTGVPALLAILTGNAASIPLDFTVNLDVTNPNQSAALFNNLQYVLKIDNVQFASGSTPQSLNVASGSTQVLPLNFSIDLASLMKQESKNAVQNIVKNFIGISDQKSKVSLNIKPSFTVAGRNVPSPSYIPIEFSFGGSK